MPQLRTLAVAVGAGSRSPHEAQNWLLPQFGSTEAALHGAITQGLDWISSTAAGQAATVRCLPYCTNSGVSSWPRKN